MVFQRFWYRFFTFPKTKAIFLLKILKFNNNNNNNDQLNIIPKKLRLRNSFFYNKVQTVKGFPSSRTWSLTPGIRKRAVERSRTMSAVLVWPCRIPPFTTIWWRRRSWAASVLFCVSRALILSYNKI